MSLEGHCLACGYTFKIRKINSQHRCNKCNSRNVVLREVSGSTPVVRSQSSSENFTDEVRALTERVNEIGNAYSGLKRAEETSGPASELVSLEAERQKQRWEWERDEKEKLLEKKRELEMEDLKRREEADSRRQERIRERETRDAEEEEEQRQREIEEAEEERRQKLKRITQDFEDTGRPLKRTLRGKKGLFGIADGLID